MTIIQTICIKSKLSMIFGFFRILSKDYNLSDDVNLNIFAEQSEGYTGADLKAVLYNAKQLAKHDIKDVDAVLKICQDILIKALNETKPSVTVKEKARLTDM